MIVFYIGGGLANKMFQYAFSLVAKKKGLTVRYDTHTFKTEFIHDQVCLTDIFHNVQMMEYVGNSFKATGKNTKIYRIYKRLSSKYIIETAYKYNDKALNSLKEGRIAEGSWQDERYFESAKENVSKAFEFSPLKNDKNKKIADSLKRDNSVAIHIRKGDGYGTWNIFSNTCAKSYYNAAVQYIKEHVENPKFYVFSDNPKFVKDYLDIEDYTLINWNPSIGPGNYLDMQLMSYAKHNIIANSTYSWWGAWLNANPDKIVIAPRFWFNPESKLRNINHIIPANWIKL